ncbi:flavin reductase family protein [Streptomyces sedi]|uniref:Flavin reductase family protein n=1 Tax=Streptomyces sedi TaxID=555059 RepID=A0A5C4V4A9_9ACTN|nr:flavin reductase family protein [Streptomyces sedi]TNM30588.1 flavin reductase family protein [Streptomyces sedi]
MDATTSRPPTAYGASSPAPTTMREVCGLFATGVTVVTSATGDRRVGATVNSFTSVSLDPPLVLFCLRHDSGLLRAIRDSGVFAVSILSREQGQVAHSFARPGPNGFETAPATAGATGAPVLDGAVGHLECKVAEEFGGGDHQIVLGEVVSLAGDKGAAPLAFHRGALTELATGS